MLPTGIKRERKKLGISQKKLAELLKVSQPTIAGWESGRAEPNGESLAKLADIFGVTTDYLLGKKDLSREEIIEQNNELIKAKLGEGAEVIFKDIYLLDQQHLDFIKDYIDTVIARKNKQ